tara:strand:+ start:8634 stop:8777 length:144 start_codon:yes stop_codon:yes gene_type:complete
LVFLFVTFILPQRFRNRRAVVVVFVINIIKRLVSFVIFQSNIRPFQE